LRTLAMTPLALTLERALPAAPAATRPPDPIQAHERARASWPERYQVLQDWQARIGELVDAACAYWLEVNRAQLTPAAEVDPAALLDEQGRLAGILASFHDAMEGAGPHHDYLIGDSPTAAYIALIKYWAGRGDRDKAHWSREAGYIAESDPDGAADLAAWLEEHYGQGVN